MTASTGVSVGGSASIPSTPPGADGPPGPPLLFGVVGAAVITALIVRPLFVSGELIAYALIPTLVGFPVAFVQLRKALRGGRDEVVELYENGLAHHSRGVRRAWVWYEVAAFEFDVTAADRTGVIPIDGFWHTLGWHINCRIRFTDGTRLRLDGHTPDLPAITRALAERRPDLIVASDPDAGLGMILAGMLVAAVVFTVPLVLLIRYLAGKPADEVSDNLTVVYIIVILVLLPVAQHLRDHGAGDQHRHEGTDPTRRVADVGLPKDLPVRAG